MTTSDPSDWEYALESARGHSIDYADALVQVLDTAWSVEAYLREKAMPHDGATIVSLTAQVLARENQLRQERGQR
jgi:hypothetical protein